MTNEPLGGAVSRKHTFFNDCPMPLRITEYNAKVIAYGDGDTCTVAIEQEDGRAWCVTLRYNHANAPEMTEVGGPQTAAYNKSLLVLGWCTLRTRGKRDQRSRLLGDLFMWTDAKTPEIDVSAAINKFVKDNGYGTGN